MIYLLAFLAIVFIWAGIETWRNRKRPHTRDRYNAIVNLEQVESLYQERAENERRQLCKRKDDVKDSTGRTQ